jgi:cellulose 1,4-beta-cellobiosidase
VRVDNPYQGAKGYVNPDWKALATSAIGGSRISNTPTAVWIERISDIDGPTSGGTMSLRQHLDAALAQHASYIQFVIHNLPGRDCALLTSSGEFGRDEIDRYKSEFIDRIASIEQEPKYAALRIVNIIEPNALHSLILNTGSRSGATDACNEMKNNGNYEKGIAYALGRLYKAGNTYNYLDAGNHGLNGWNGNFNLLITKMVTVIQSAEGGANTVSGAITNIANYAALEEPYLLVDSRTKPSKWIDWNDYVDELSFARAFRSALVGSLGRGIGMLIDTSRNGWGGPLRPTARSTASDVNVQVDASRVDRRIHTGNWCNQTGAGLGERPTAAPASGIDAYIWAYAPGVSDGSSTLIQNDQGLVFFRMCDPTYLGNANNSNNRSGALDGAPLRGQWFASQFSELMDNAYPPL